MIKEDFLRNIVKDDTVTGLATTNHMFHKHGDTIHTLLLERAPNKTHPGTKEAPERLTKMRNLRRLPTERFVRKRVVMTVYWFIRSRASTHFDGVARIASWPGELLAMGNLSNPSRITGH